MGWERQNISYMPVPRLVVSISLVMANMLEMWIKNGGNRLHSGTHSFQRNRAATDGCRRSCIFRGGIGSTGREVRGWRDKKRLENCSPIGPLWSPPSVPFGCNAHSTQLRLLFHALLNFALRWSCRWWWVIRLSIVRLVKLDRSWAFLSVIYICTKCLLKADFFTRFELCSRIIQLRNRLICSPWLTAPFASSLSDSSCFKAEHRWMLPPQ
jgi:hypothetical protein